MSRARGPAVLAVAEWGALGLMPSVGRGTVGFPSAGLVGGVEREGRPVGVSRASDRYAQAMRREDGENERLRALVDGVSFGSFGSAAGIEPAAESMERAA
jgi:hypothetical protein